MDSTDENTSLETSTPITTPIVRESQVGRLLKIFWFALGFMWMAIAFASLNVERAEAAPEGEGFLKTKACDFSVKTGMKNADLSFRAV